MIIGTNYMEAEKQEMKILYGMHALIVLNDHLTLEKLNYHRNPI